MNEKQDRHPLLESDLGGSSDGPITGHHSTSGILQRFRLATRMWTPIDSMQHSFNPSIEGLRGIAVSLTMLCHILDMDYYLLRQLADAMGVTIFFVLSGFLITGVLIRAQVREHF